MKYTFFEKITLILIIVLAIFFRTNHLEGKLTFEWDQSRDFAAAEQMLKSGSPALLGPVVRGDLGGFYLGPLYYYLVTPLYYYSGGNPLALGAVSIVADLLVIILLYSFLRTRVSRSAAGFITFLWASSPLIIHDSYTPWNVSLISLWTILYLSTLTRLIETARFRYKFAAIFLSSLTLNIHLSLLPVVAVTLLSVYKSFIKLSLKQYLYLLVAFITPLSTLILHDLTHDLANLRLFKQFLLSMSDKSGSILVLTSTIIEKFGYTIGRLFTGEPYTLLGLTIVVAISLYSLIGRSKRHFAILSLLSIFAVIASLIYYHDPNFAEYYFMPTYIPILLLCATTLDGILKISHQYFAQALLGLLVLTYLFLGYHTRQEPISPYSLTVKKSVIQAIKQLDYPVEVRMVLPRERNTAFPYIMSHLGVVSDPNATRKAYIYEVKNLEIISPKEARSIILDQPIQAFKLIIFSN